jgi:hypothetical protein
MATIPSIAAAAMQMASRSRAALYNIFFIFVSFGFHRFSESTVASCGVAAHSIAQSPIAETPEYFAADDRE